MLTFLKAQASSLLATFLDFSTAIVLVNFFEAEPFISSVIGTCLGGLANFVINRYWVFHASQNSLGFQAVKYFLVWLGNLGLNAGGVYLLVVIAQWHYVFSKALVSLAVGFGYNYVLQKKLVFRKDFTQEG